MDQVNDGRFPDDSPAEVRYPRTKQEEQGDRSEWPWLPGSILEQCGPDGWYVCMEVGKLAGVRDGRRAPHGAAARTCTTRAVTGIARRSGRALGARRLTPMAGWAGERGPADPLQDRGRRARTP
jgi:hypothetical protein